MTAFGDRLSVLIPDPDHAIEEERLLLIGHANSGILTVVSFTQRDDKLRINSARRASPRERRNYEDGD